MKIQNIKNPEELLRLIDSCEGKVELVTEEGDRLNLKSKLCQYISLTSIFSSVKKIPQVEIIAYEPEDIKKLMDYMMKG
ncbi:polya polymerase [Anaerosporobacter sp.]|uniref:polya polymerase n=1 Tax=Anaerosporobacter sp. TaxID=1872529 RepID=UPI00286EEA93|nr:polya polymerase [Anaerosporobacter sp.]